MDPKEIRLNGFFSDPNKYMAYIFILMYFIEIFWKTMKKMAITFLCIGNYIEFFKNGYFDFTTLFFG